MSVKLEIQSLYFSVNNRYRVALTISINLKIYNPFIDRELQRILVKESIFVEIEKIKNDDKKEEGGPQGRHKSTKFNYSF